jgi:acyl-coenzyme A synthetase/AMP-(fatty) acid ligase
VVFIQELPRNPLGKVLRRVLREMPDPPLVQAQAEEALTAEAP